MVTTTDPIDIKFDIDRLAAKYTDQADDIKESIDKLVAEYEDRIDELETSNNDLEYRVSELEDALNEKESSQPNLEEYASAMLRTFTSHEPNMGEVLSLKDDLENLLTTKYNISLGNI